jgi:hypothetical protein
MRKTLKAAATLLLCFGVNSIAKADSFTGTIAGSNVTFAGVDVYDVNSSASSNPFGITRITCPGGAPCGSNLGGGFEIATIIFTSTGGFIINPSSKASNGNSEGAWENTTPAATSIFSVSGSTLTVGTGSQSNNASSFGSVPSCPSGGTGWCFNGNDQNGGSVLTYLGNGVFTASDNSEEVAFSLNAPEPSSLMMLGFGLLGLMGLGLRRKSVV